MEQQPDGDHDYDAREEKVATGVEPEDLGGTEGEEPEPGEEHAGDARGG